MAGVVMLVGTPFSAGLEGQNRAGRIVMWLMSLCVTIMGHQNVQSCAFCEVSRVGEGELVFWLVWCVLVKPHHTSSYTAILHICPR